MKIGFCLIVSIVINFTVLIDNVSAVGAGKPAAGLSFIDVAQGRNSITGFVFNESRSPVSDIYVELQNENYLTVARAKTNGSGLFSFRGIPQGQYNVKVLVYGRDYEGQTRSVSLIGISAVPGSGSVNEQVDFYLKLKKNTTTGPLAAPSTVFAQEIPDSAKKLYETGIENLSNKKEKEGFENLKKALEIFPDYFLALDRLGTEYVMRGYYRAAFVLLSKAVEINPRSFSSLFGLGLAQFRLEEVDKAIENLSRANEIYNQSVNGYLWLGIALHKKGKINEAMTALLKANKLSKGEAAEVHWQLARVYKDQNLYTKAAEELELYLKYNSSASNSEEVKKTISTLRQKENKP